MWPDSYSPRYGKLRPAHIGIPCINNSGGDFTKGTLVYITGWSTAAQAFKVSKAAAGTAFAQLVCDAALANGSSAVLRSSIILSGMNTNGKTINDPLYLDTTAGAGTYTAPVRDVQIVGFVRTVSATDGKIEFCPGMVPPLKSSLVAPDLIQLKEVALTNAQMLALRATPITLVAAPAAGYVNQLIEGRLYMHGVAGYTETDDNLAIRYKDGSGIVVADIEATGFVDQTADISTSVQPKADAIATKAQCDAQPLVLHNSGDGEYGGGNAGNTMKVRLTYRVVPVGW